MNPRIPAWPGACSEYDQISSCSSEVSELLRTLRHSLSTQQDEVQQEAVSSLLDVVASSQDELDALVNSNYSQLLVHTMQCGSLHKRSCIAAILGLLSMCEQERGLHCHPPLSAARAWSQTPDFALAITTTVRLLKEAGPADLDCQAMILNGLDSLVYNFTGLELFIQAGGIPGLTTILTNLGHVPVCLAEGPDCDEDVSDVSDTQSSEVHQVWLLVLNLLYKTVKYTTCGVLHVTATPLLTALVRCTSSNSDELQLAALDILLMLASMPITWPAFVKAGQAWHFAVAAQSACLEVQGRALSCIYALSATFTQQEEESMVRLGDLVSSSTQASAVPAKDFSLPGSNGISFGAACASTPGSQCQSKM